MGGRHIWGNLKDFDPVPNFELKMPSFFENQDSLWEIKELDYTLKP
jgi:hypothetical protein